MDELTGDQKVMIGVVEFTSAVADRMNHLSELALTYRDQIREALDDVGVMSICLWCGTDFRKEEALAHIENCDKHPLFAAKQRIAELTDTLAEIHSALDLEAQNGRLKADSSANMIRELISQRDARHG